MIIKFSKKFDKSYQKLTIKIQDKFNKRLVIFEKNKLEPILNNHSLSWKLKWCRSINITWDYRAIFEEKDNWEYEFIEFINIWSHSELY